MAAVAMRVCILLGLAHLAASCSTANITGYTAGKGVTGNTCPSTMKEGDTCHASCGTNYTMVGSIKCMGGELKDVSICVKTELLDKMARHQVTKVIGALNVGFSKEPSKQQLYQAVVDGLEIPAHFVEAVWVAGRTGDLYTVKFWIIVKPGMDPSVMRTKAQGLATAGDKHNIKFKAAVEGVTSVAEASVPVVVNSTVLKDHEGRNVNPWAHNELYA